MIELKFAAYEKLNKKEKVLFEELDNLNGDSMWWRAIRNVCDNPDIFKFRKLVCDLKSQAADCPEVMQNILGKEIYQLIIEL